MKLGKTLLNLGTTAGTVSLILLSGSVRAGEPAPGVEPAIGLKEDTTAQPIAAPEMGLLARTEEPSSTPSTTSSPGTTQPIPTGREVPSEVPPPSPKTAPSLSGEQPPTPSGTSASTGPAPTLATPNPASTAAQGLTPTIEILSPLPEQLLERPAVTVLLRFTTVDAKGNPLVLKLDVNGKEVDSSQIGRNELDGATKVSTQTWYGVALDPGENTITARLIGKEGLVTVATVKVSVRGTPAQLTLTSLASRLPADGRSTATIRGELLDEEGNRSIWDTIVTLTSSGGEFVGADLDLDQPGFQIKAERGQFTIPVRAGLNPGTLQIRAVAGEREALTQIQLDPGLRPSLVTGVVDFRIGARGMDFFRSYQDFLPADRDTSTRVDVRSALFATGRVGEWLFTGAYNSDRALNQTCDRNRLFRDLQFCDQSYPVYGDSSTVVATTPSIDSLYFKFERASSTPNASSDYVMWGDYDTLEFANRSQQFTSTTRQLHGLKANFNLGNLQLSALYGDNVRGFQRDIIPPDGTSGTYFLSRRLLLAGSENVFLETEELNRPGTVIQRTALQRGQDYEIDYDRGSLVFRRPILQTELDLVGQVLVRRIVVTYQYETPGDSNSIYAGRARYHFSRTPGQETWVAATFFRENQGIRSFELYGADALVTLGKSGRVIAEYARSNNTSEMMGPVSGSAYRLEANGELFPGIAGQAYYREAEPGFANNATISFVAGQRRYGALVNGRVSPTTIARFQYDREDNYGTAPRTLTTLEDLLTPRVTAPPGTQQDNSLSTYTLGLQQRLGRASMDLDFIHRDRQDRIATNLFNGSSDQLRTRFTYPLLDNLTFVAQNETTLSGRDPVYSDRTVVALDWALYQGINMRLGQQFFTSGPLAGNSITSLDMLGSYAVGPDTNLTARYSILTGVSGVSNQGAVGLNHRWVISSGLRMNLAYERVFGEFRSVTAAGNQFIQPFTTGSSTAGLSLLAGDSYSVGLEYTDSPDFQASARYEFRNSTSSSSNTVITAAAAGKVTPALTALLRYQQANSSNQAIVGLGDTATLRMGLAYRDPTNDSFNALLRYDYRRNPATIPNTILISSGSGSEDHTFALETIYALNWQWELYGKFALRSSNTYLSSNLVGTSSITLGQLRATYRMGYNTDLVAEGRWITQPITGYNETGYVVEAGYYLTPNLRASVGYSSGSVIAGDLVGSRSASGLYAGLTVKLNELFEGFGLQTPLPPPQQQESKVSTAPTPSNVQATIPPVLRLDLTQTLKFEAESANLNVPTAEALDNVAVVLREYPTMTVEIEGYLASLLTAAPTLDLDARRAMMARNYLLSQGVQSQQVVLRSLGQRPEGLQANSTVEMTLTGASTTFGQLANRLKNEGAVSPVLEILQSLLPEAERTIAQAQTTGETGSVAQSVFFSVDSGVQAESQGILNQILASLRSTPRAIVELQGYATASQGTDREMERVMALRNTLMDQGIDADRIVIRSLSETTPPIQAGGTPSMPQNRVDLILSRMPSVPVTILSSEDLPMQPRTFTNYRTPMPRDLLTGMTRAPGETVVGRETLIQALRLAEPTSERLSLMTTAPLQLTAFLPADSPLLQETGLIGMSPRSQRLIAALNALLGQDQAAAAMILKAMGIRPAEVQGVLIDPSLLDKKGGPQ